MNSESRMRIAVSLALVAAALWLLAGCAGHRTSNTEFIIDADGSSTTRSLTTTDIISAGKQDTASSATSKVGANGEWETGINAQVGQDTQAVPLAVTAALGQVLGVAIQYAAPIIADVIQQRNTPAAPTPDISSLTDAQIRAIIERLRGNTVVPGAP